jgi:predicted O-methyltransferase YrrM
MIPKQIKEEITQLLKLLSKNPPKTICEIGTAEGGTLFLFSKVSNPDATIISIDLPESRSTKWRIPFYKSFATHNQKIHIIHSNSHSLYTVEKVQQILNNRKLDFLFIDGDHSYEGVKEDFEMYSKLVDKNGLIAFHDICLHPPQTGCKVNQFWNEIKQRYKHLEIIKNPKQNWAGIGIVQTNKNLF